MSDAPPTHLLQRRALQARLAFDQEQADAARAWAAGAHGERDEIGPHARGDEGLRAVEDVAVGIAPRGRPQVRNIGAAARLRDGERGDLFARKYCGSTRAFISSEPRLQDRRRADRVAEEARRYAAGAARPISCIAMMRMKRSHSVPPYRSGKPRPI